MEDRQKKWNSDQTRLRILLSKPKDFSEAIELCKKQHRMVHESIVYANVLNPETGSVKTFEDDLWKDLDEVAFRKSVGSKKRTVAYGMWHSTRIEDMTMSVLVGKKTQTLDLGDWKEKLGASIYDTGNWMNEQEILEFSSNINMEALRAYRNEVGIATIDILNELTIKDLKRKIDHTDIAYLRTIGAVRDVPEANWLLDFWERKTVSGILLMPVTRHLMVHINESMDAKRKWKNK